MLKENKKADCQCIVDDFETGRFDKKHEKKFCPYSLKKSKMTLQLRKRWLPHALKAVN